MAFHSSQFSAQHKFGLKLRLVPMWPGESVLLWCLGKALFQGTRHYWAERILPSGESTENHQNSAEKHSLGKVAEMANTCAAGTTLICLGATWRLRRRRQLYCQANVNELPPLCPNAEEWDLFMFFISTRRRRNKNFYSSPPPRIHICLVYSGSQWHRLHVNLYAHQKAT